MGVEPKLIEGRGGVFEVKVDDHMLFSKHEIGRFPEHEEIIKLIQSL